MAAPYIGGSVIGNSGLSGEVIKPWGAAFDQDLYEEFPEETPARTDTAIVPSLGGRCMLMLDQNWYALHRAVWVAQLARAAVEGDRQMLTFFNFHDPLQEDATPNYASIDILGRAEGYRVFTGTQNKEIPFTVTFKAQGVQPGTVGEVVKREVTDPVRFIDALRYPVYDEVLDVSFPPPPVFLVLGRFLTARGVLSSVNIRWLPPVIPDTLQYTGAEVSATLTVTHAAGSRPLFNGPVR